MIIKFLGILNIVQLVLILGSVIFFLIYRTLVKSKENEFKKKEEEYIRKIVQYHSFSETLYANLHLLKYYEKVDLETQKKIDIIAENINAYLPIANEFTKWLKQRELDEKNIIGNKK